MDRPYTTSAEILKDYKRLKAIIKDYELKLEELDFDTTGPRAMAYDGDRISPTFKFNSETENTVIKREERVKDLTIKKRVTEIIIERVENAIDSLKERERKVVELKYINDKTYEEIAEIIDRTPIRCQQIMDEAIEKIDIIMGF
jgi:RNA polymerase sigma factor (sigma-70 family)